MVEAPVKVHAVLVLQVGVDTLCPAGIHAVVVIADQLTIFNFKRLVDGDFTILRDIVAGIRATPMAIIIIFVVVFVLVLIASDEPAEQKSTHNQTPSQ